MYIHVRVSVNQKEDRISERKPGYFDVLVRDKAEQNMANRKIIKIFADYFTLKEKDIHIISGHHKPSKILDISLP